MTDKEGCEVCGGPCRGGLESDERTCARCGDQVQYLSSDNLCDGCTSATTERYRPGSGGAEFPLCDPDGVVRGGALHHGTDYPCTGHAHYAGHHIRCTSVAHVYLGEPVPWRMPLPVDDMNMSTGARLGSLAAVRALVEELEGFTVNRNPGPGSYDAGVVAAFVNVAARLRSILAAHEQNGGQQVPTAVEMIAAERARQIEIEGWTPDHDAEHTAGDLARAAACYALPEPWRSDDIWPWHPGWWKPSPDDRVRELVKAGALIAAEIDRLRALAVGRPGPIDPPRPAGHHPVA